MKLVRIRDRYLFKSKEPDKVHTYAAYWHKPDNEYRLIQTTHLYRRDEKRFGQLKQGLLKKVTLPGFETPSGVKNHYYATDINGRKITLNNSNVVGELPKGLPAKQAADIRRFARYRYEKGKFKE